MFYAPTIFVVATFKSFSAFRTSFLHVEILCFRFVKIFSQTNISLSVKYIVNTMKNRINLRSKLQKGFGYALKSEKYRYFCSLKVQNYAVLYFPQTQAETI